MSINTITSIRTLDVITGDHEYQTRYEGRGTKIEKWLETYEYVYTSTYDVCVTMIIVMLTTLAFF